MSKKPSYTDEFKRDAINLVLAQGYRLSEAARNLGISESALRRWVRVHQEDGEPVNSAPRSLVEVEIENNELRKKLKRLEMERDILKRRQPSLPTNPSKVRLYSRATEGLSNQCIMRSNEG